MNVVQKSITLEVAEADEQIVGGFISTQNRDRHGDIVEPDGCDTSRLQVRLETITTNPRTISSNHKTSVIGLTVT